jgi:hypothetical protein
LSITAFGHAGDIVDGVAHQRQVIDDAVRRDAEFRHHARVVELFIAHRVDQHDFVVDQLREVFVARGDNHVHAARRCLHRQRADHIIGFDAVDHQDRPAHVAHCFVDRLNLQAQVVRHRRAGRLVLRVHIVAEGFAFCIEDAGNVRRRVIGPQAAQHVDHAVHRAGRVAVGAAQVGQGVESAVQIAGTVNEQEGILHEFLSS